MRSGLPTGGLPRCHEVGCPTDYDGYMVRYIWFLSKYNICKIFCYCIFMIIFTT